MVCLPNANQNQYGPKINLKFYKFFVLLNWILCTIQNTIGTFTILGKDNKKFLKFCVIGKIYCTFNKICLHVLTWTLPVSIPCNAVIPCCISFLLSAFLRNFLLCPDRWHVDVPPHLAQPFCVALGQALDLGLLNVNDNNCTY